jgi:hypothetical protein
VRQISLLAILAVSVAASPNDLARTQPSGSPAPSEVQITLAEAVSQAQTRKGLARISVTAMDAQFDTSY